MIARWSVASSKPSTLNSTPGWHWSPAREMLLALRTWIVPDLHGQEGLEATLTVCGRTVNSRPQEAQAS
jgi:hypothetical protein